jgi:hypothetical protein
MFCVWSAQERLARICFGLDDPALRRYLLALRSALEETRKCIYLLALRSALKETRVYVCLLCGVLWKRLACVFCCFCGVLEGDSRCIYLLALRSALEETRICICLLFWVSLSIERRVCGFCQFCGF